MENHLFLIGKSTISRAIFNSYVTLQRDGTMTCVFKLEHQMEKHVVAIAVAVVVDNVVEDMIMMVMMAMSST